MVLLEFLLIGQQTVSLVVLPNLLDQDLPFQLVEIVLDVAGHLDVVAEPVDGLVSLQQGHSEDATVLSV